MDIPDDSNLTKTERIVFKVTPPMKEALTHVARDNCISVSELARRCILNCMEQYPKFGEVYSIDLPIQDTEN